MKRKLMLTLFFVFVVAFVTGCGAETENVNVEDIEESTSIEATDSSIGKEKAIVEMVEDSIISSSKEVGEEFKSLHKNQDKLVIEKKDDRFIIYPEGEEDNPFTLLYPSDYFDNRGTELLDMSNIKQYEKNEMYEIAENLAINYVKYSSYIKDEDRKDVIEYVKNTSVNLADFQEETDKETNTGYVMLTNGNTIYVNRNLTDYVYVYTYLHELIHVISNYTNQNTAYENSAYRYSVLNEAITDLIASQLSQVSGIDFSYSTYTDYYQFALIAIDRFDMMETYFYSDGYEAIKNSLPQNQWDVFELLSENSDGASTDAVNAYLVNEWYNEED